MVTPEQLGEMVAMKIIRSPSFKARVEELASCICDELVYNAANELRSEAENSLGIKFEDPENYQEFGMTCDGDLVRAIIPRLAEFISDY